MVACTHDSVSTNPPCQDMAHCILHLMLCLQPLTTFLLLLLLLSCLQLGTYKVKVMLAEPKTKRARPELNLGLFGMGPLGHLQGLAGLDPTGEGVGCSVTFFVCFFGGGGWTGNRFRVDTGDGREAGGGALC